MLVVHLAFCFCRPPIFRAAEVFLFLAPGSSPQLFYFQGFIARSVARSPNQQPAFCFGHVFVFVGEREVVCMEGCF